MLVFKTNFSAYIEDFLPEKHNAARFWNRASRESASARLRRFAALPNWSSSPKRKNIVLVGENARRMMMMGSPFHSRSCSRCGSHYLSTTGSFLPSTEAIDDPQVTVLNGNGQFEHSLEVVRKHLRKSKSGRVMVGAVNDPSAIGVLRAFEEAGRVEHCAAMGQNASAEARAEIRNARWRLIGSVAYFPERHGEAVIPLAVGILQGRPTPPAVFVRHQLVTRDTIDHLYPEDFWPAKNSAAM